MSDNLQPPAGPVLTSRDKNAAAKRLRRKERKIIKSRERLASRRLHPLVKVVFNEIIDKEIQTIQLAYEAGYAYETISRWYSGRGVPSLNAITDVLDALGFDLIAIRRKM